MPDEKFDEKDMEKRDEKNEKEEKNWDEKWRNDPLGAIIWAAILIWAGLVFLASNLGLLDTILARTSELRGLGFLEKVVNAWPIVLIGAGVILLIEVLIRLLMPTYRRPVTGTIILAIIFIGIGLGDLTPIGWNIIWPLILIILGASILFRELKRSKQ
jgi:hypothetical protein